MDVSNLKTPAENARTFLEELKQLKIQTGCSTEALATLLRMPRSTIKDWLNGVYKPSHIGMLTTYQNAVDEYARLARVVAALETFIN
jgi:DNA-binding transcriptional regulator YiaG